MINLNIEEKIAAKIRDILADENIAVEYFTTGKYQPYEIVAKYGADPIPDGCTIIILKDRTQAEK